MTRTDIPWEKIYDYVLACGGQHDPYQFVVTALEEIDELIPYNQGLAYCLDERRRVQAQYLLNIKSRWSNLYIDYYSHLQRSGMGLTVPINETPGMPFIRQIRWDELPKSEFITTYIMARGVKCSLAFTFFDQRGLPRAVFSLDRTHLARFTEREEEILRLAAAQLGNLYKNFFTNPDSVPGRLRTDDGVPQLETLTTREREICDLLTQGLSPALIGEVLHISVSTAYKHIAHIYKKLGVSSNQELLVRVLGSKQ